MLCNVCIQMFQAGLNGLSEEGDHHQTLVSLLDAAEAGCYVCEFARQRYLENDKRDNCQVERFKFRSHGSLLSKSAETYNAFFGLDMKLCHGREIDTNPINFIAAPTRGFATNESEKVRRRKGCIMEAEAIVKIQKWMGLCLHDHDGNRCRKNASGAQPSSYPSRLLELGPSSFRVLRTAVDKPRGPYTTLSYCWGPNPAFLRLTAWNEKELEAGVSTSQLPIAFREAISVIQALSFRYLWIDALCIVQSGPGSAEDWEKESARMHQIYANSILTLALACVASPFESILNQAPMRKTAAPPFQIKVDSGYRDPVVGVLTIVPVDYFVHTLYEQPLSCRAWALQERVMATRVVSFGLGELFWDCAQLSNASESIPGGLQATQMKPSRIRSFRLAEKTIPDGSNTDALLKTWWSLLLEYVERDLTYPKTDRLVALSAIAHDIGKAMDDVYIAGHFWKTLPRSLNWVSKNWPRSTSNRYGGKARRLFWSEKSDAKDNGPCTPSWSWASMDGPVFLWRYEGPDPQQLADAVSYTLELSNQANPTGPCMHASVSIRAYCTELEWQSQNKPVMVALEKGFFCFSLDEPEVRRAEGTKSLMVALTEDKQLLEWAGLIVERMPHQEEIRCRRIGHFAIYGDNIKGSTWWDDRISIFGGEKKLIELV